MVKELLIGAVLGFFTNLIITVILYAGELMDTEIGLGMAKAYDPATGVTMPVFGNYYYYLFILYFFLTNGHLTYLKLFSLSYQTIPIGYEFTDNTLNLAYIIVMYMGTVMELALKFAMPILAVELIVEMCMGIIMKAVPTIQIFVLNVHLKLIIGFIVRRRAFQEIPVIILEGLNVNPAINYLKVKCSVSLFYNVKLIYDMLFNFLSIKLLSYFLDLFYNLFECHPNSLSILPN